MGQRLALPPVPPMLLVPQGPLRQLQSLQLQQQKRLLLHVLHL